jgi:hypothetical protein
MSADGQVSPRRELEIYGAIAADLARGRDRGEALAAHGLDEERFDALEERALAAMAADDDAQDGIPEPIAQFDAALRVAHAPEPHDVPSLEDFVRALMVAQEGGKVHERLAERGLSLELLLRGSGYYTPKLVSDPELARRFQELCSRSGSKRR